jgi:hypothetical protein
MLNEVKHPPINTETLDFHSVRVTGRFLDSPFLIISVNLFFTSEDARDLDQYCLLSVGVCYTVRRISDLLSVLTEGSLFIPIDYCPMKRVVSGRGGRQQIDRVTHQQVFRNEDVVDAVLT